VTTIVEPGSWEELAEVVTTTDRLVVGRGDLFRNTPERTLHEIVDFEFQTEYPIGTEEGDLSSKARPSVRIVQEQLPQKFELDTQNQTVTVGAGIDFSLFLFDLAQTEFTVPHHYQVKSLSKQAFSCQGTGSVYENAFQSVGDAIATNARHALVAQHGSWRDWLLSAKVMLADGSIIQSGAPVVKSVSGFDLHKLMIGARHTLGILLEVTLRVVPRSSLSRSEFIRNDDHQIHLWNFATHGNRNTILHCPEQTIGVARETFAEDVIAFDPASNTLWLECFPETLAYLSKFGNVQANFWGDEPEINSPQAQALMRRTKQLFDPTNKLNPGEFGFI